MNNLKKYTLFAIAFFTLIANIPISAQEETPRIIHVFVALCDNVHQGIVPVPPKLGNGDDPNNNLYWGAMYGVKTFFARSQNWTLISTVQQPNPVPQQERRKWLSRLTTSKNPVLERCIFRHTRENVYLIADAYQGSQIKEAINDFLNAASGSSKEVISVQTDSQLMTLNIHGASNLMVYVGHDGLMDFQLKNYPQQQDENPREAIILACISQRYFYEAVIQSGVKPLLWTTGLMAPEAYTLESALEGWIAHESDEDIRLRAAKAYNKYQKCGLKAAKRLLVTGM